MHTPTYAETFFDPALRRASWIGCTLAALQQLTGINSIIFYSTTIFESEGSKPSFPIPNQFTAIIMTVNFIAALLSYPVLRAFGRRTVLLSTFAICTFSLVAMALVQSDFAKLSASVIFVISFEQGPGPICWFYMSEVTNEKGVAVGTFINWTFTLIFSLSTPTLFA